MGKKVFRDIVSTIDLNQIFEDAERSYAYNKTSDQFEHVVTGEPYDPQPGDFLGRFDPANPGQVHSMMVIGWNPSTTVLSVVNGPWPVTVRAVNVDTDSRDFTVGRVLDVLPDLDIGENVSIGRDVELGMFTVIGEDTNIGRDTIIGDKVTVGSNVEIGRDVTIARNLTIGNDVVIGRGANIISSVPSGEVIDRDETY